jgi:hypothetical protein
MATYATNLNTFWLDGATTVSALGGGGAGLGNPETDTFIQGSSCISKGAWTNAIKGFIIDGLAANFTVPADGAVIAYAKYDAAGSLATKASGGFRYIIGSSSGDYHNYYVGGSDTLAYDSWVAYVVDPNTATADATTGTPAGTERWVGVLANLPTTSGPTKGNPIAMDAIRYGRCDLTYTATACTFTGAEAWANDTTRRLGLLALRSGSYLMQGFHSFGTAAASVTFSDANKGLFFLDSGGNNLSNNAVSTGFNRIEVLNAGSSVTWDNISVSALGTRARGIFVHTAGTIAFTSCQFVDMDTFSLIATSVITDTTWRRCNAITAPNSDLRGSSVLSPTVALNTSGLIWNTANDPDGNLDDMTFSKGANAHHAIEFGLLAPLTITLRGCTVTGFNAANAANDSVLHIKRTSGTVNIYIIDGIGTFSYKTEGAVVNVIPDPRTVSITAQTDAGTAIENARVFLRTAAAGDLPFNAAVTISNATVLATVTHTAHGMASGDKVVIYGAANNQNLGIHSIAVLTVNTYTYTTTSLTTTDSGTASFIFVEGLTNVSGKITANRVYPSNQLATGSIRKSTSAPYFKQSGLNGTVSSALDTSFTGVMISDD